MAAICAWRAAHWSAGTCQVAIGTPRSSVTSSAPVGPRVSVRRVTIQPPLSRKVIGLAPASGEDGAAWVGAVLGIRGGGSGVGSPLSAQAASSPSAASTPISNQGSRFIITLLRDTARRRGSTALHPIIGRREQHSGSIGPVLAGHCRGQKLPRRSALPILDAAARVVVCCKTARADAPMLIATGGLCARIAPGRAPAFHCHPYV